MCVWVRAKNAAHLQFEKGVKCQLQNCGHVNLEDPKEAKTSEATANRKQKKLVVLFFGEQVRKLHNNPVKIKTDEYANLDATTDPEYQCLP